MTLEMTPDTSLWCSYHSGFPFEPLQRVLDFDATSDRILPNRARDLIRAAWTFGRKPSTRRSNCHSTTSNFWNFGLAKRRSHIWSQNESYPGWFPVDFLIFLVGSLSKASQKGLLVRHKINCECAHDEERRAVAKASCEPARPPPVQVYQSVAQ